MVIFCAKGFTPHREKKASPSPAPISGDRSGEIRFDFVQRLSPAFDEFRHDFVQRLSPAFAEFRLGFVRHLLHLLDEFRLGFVRPLSPFPDEFRLGFVRPLSPFPDEFRLSFVHPRFPVPADFRLGFVQTSFDFLPKSERLPTKTHVRLVQIHYIWCFNHAPISNLLELIFFSSARFQVVLSQTSA